MKTINSTKARNHFGEVMEEVYHLKAPIIIERRGKPFVAILPLGGRKGPATPFRALEIPTFKGGSLLSNLSRQNIYGNHGR